MLPRPGFFHEICMVTLGIFENRVVTLARMLTGEPDGAAAKAAFLAHDLASFVT